MLLELPKDLYSASSELLFPDDKPVGIISPAKDGILVYGINGKLIGQSFMVSENTMRISVGDGSSVDVKKEGKTVTVFPSPLDTPMMVNHTNYVFFGNPDTFHYKFYVKKEGVLAPEEIATVVPHLYRPTCYIKLSECTDNLIRTLLICLSVNQL